MGCVLDASAALSLLAPSQSTAMSRAFALALPQGLAAPWVLRIEVRHALRRLERAQRLDARAADASLAQLERLIVFESPLERPGLDRAMTLSRANALGYFDALYLELALGSGASVASRDKALLAAAQGCGVPIHDLN
jgi:predicted nucleic acid-binding protein